MRAIVPIFLLLLITFTSFSQADTAALEDVYSSAGKLLEDGSYKEAVLDYTRLINSGYENEAVWVKRGMAHFYLEEYESALKDFDEAFKRQVRIPDLLGYRALTRHYLSGSPGTVTELEQAFSSGFRNSRAAMVTGNTFFENENYERAIHYYDLAAGWGSEDPVLFNNRGKARLLINKYEEALSDFDRSVTLDATYARARSNRAAALFQTGKQARALEDLIWLEQNGHRFSGDEFAMRGLIRLGSEEFTLAAEDLENALQRSGELPGLYKGLGISLFHTGDTQRAISMLENALEKEGPDHEVSALLARLYYDRKQYGTSLKYSTEALENGGNSVEVRSVNGLALYHEGESGRALEILNEVAGSSSLDEVHLVRAEILFEQQNWEEALQAAGHYKGGNSAELGAILSASLFSLERYEEARTALTDWKKIAPNAIEPWLLSTRNNMVLADYEAAGKDITKAVELDSESQEVNALYGEVLLMNKDYQQAAHVLEKALKIRSNAQTHALLGMAYFRLENYPQAYEQLVIPAAVGKLSDEALQDLAVASLETERYQAALKYAGEAAGEAVPVAETLRVKGLAAFALGDYEKAEENLKGAVEAGSRDTRALRALGETEMSNEAYAEAVNWFDQALGQGEDPDLRYLRGQAMDRQENFTAALADYSTVLEADKDHDPARFARGSAYFMLENYTKAPEDLLLVNNRSLDLPVNEMIAVSYSITENDRALEYLEKAIKLGTEMPDVYYHAGRLHAGQEAWEKALARLDLAEEKGFGETDLFEVRGEVHFWLENYENSLKDLGRTGTNTRLIGLSHYYLEHFQEAIGYLEKATPDRDVLLALGDSFFRVGQKNKARQIFTTLIDAGDATADVWRHRGQLLASSEEWAGAITDFRNALQLAPGDQETVLMLGDALYKNQQFEETIRLYDEHKDVNGLQAVAGLSSYQTGNYQQATELLEELARAGGSTPEIQAALGHIYHQSANHEKAVENLTLACSSGTAPVEWKTWYGISLSALEKHPQALMVLKDAMGAGAENPEVYAAAGISAYGTGENEEAIQFINEAISKGSKDPAAYFTLGNAQFKRKDYELAVNAYDEAVSAGLRDAILWNNRGKALANLEKYEEAISSYDQALNIDGEYLRALENRGEAHFILKNYKPAIEDLRKVINLDEEEDGSVRLMLADACAATGEDRQAIIFYGEAERRGENGAALYFKRGASYARLGDLENALSDLNQAYAGGKQDAELFLERANVHIGLENTRAAISDLNEAISRDEGNADAWYNRGYLHELNENFKEAVYDYQQAVKLNPEDHMAFYSLANSMVSQGNVAGALKPIEQAISLDPENGTYYKVKGNILYRNDRNDEACAAWQKAVDLGDTKAGYYIGQYCD